MTNEIIDYRLRKRKRDKDTSKTLHQHQHSFVQLLCRDEATPFYEVAVAAAATATALIMAAFEMLDSNTNQHGLYHFH